MYSIHLLVCFIVFILCSRLAMCAPNNYGKFRIVLNSTEDENSRVSNATENENSSALYATEDDNNRASYKTEDDNTYETVDEKRRGNNHASYKTEDENNSASYKTEDENNRASYKTEDENRSASYKTEDENNRASYATEDGNNRASSATEDENNRASYKTEDDNMDVSYETVDEKRRGKRRASYKTEENNTIGTDADWVCWDTMDNDLGMTLHPPPSVNWTGVRFQCGDVDDESSGPCVCIECNKTQVVAMCNSTNLQHVPRFPNLTIDYLMFFGNHIQVVNDSSFFQNVPDLRRLDLDNNIRSLTKDAFKLLTKLELLRLNNNVYLDVSKNIEAIFSVKTLRVLDISNTLFGVDFPDDTFIRYPLPQLERLYVHHSTMRFWDVGLFQPLTSLQYIAVNSNDMKQVNTSGLDATDKSINVTYVDLAVNDMYDFPTTCRNGSATDSFFPHLETLDLHGNRLYGIPAKGDKHVCLPSLTTLQLSWNILEYFFTDMFSRAKFPQLQVLYLDRLSVTVEIQAYAFNNSHLQFLSMVYNNIDFTHSHKTQVNDSAFLGLTGLRTLHLEHNWGLTGGRLAQLFKDSNKLQHLYLANTFLDVITPDTFKPFPDLVNLSLYHNPITTLTPGAFDSLTKLKFLDLSTCWIVTLSESQFSLATRQRLVRLDLSDNNFRCDCDLMWLRDWMVRDKSKFSNSYSNYECQTPPELSGTLVTDYKMQEQSCLMSHTVASVIITVVTLWVLLLTSVPCLYRYRWHIRLMLYEAFRGTNQRLLLPADFFRYDVFVSYAEEDLRWVRSNLLSHLETQVGLRLCLHQRDFTPGENIVDNIFNSVQTSRKLIMVFSRHFARSEWCQFELAMCLQHVIDNDDTLVIVCVDDVTSVGCSLLTTTMMAVLLTTTYIQWEGESDAVRSFWGRLRLALYEILPSKSKKSTRARNKSKVFTQPRGVTNVLAQQPRHRYRHRHHSANM